MAIAPTLTAFRTGFGLCWKKETNWGVPFAWLPYVLVRPISGAVILWIMYTVAHRPPGFVGPAWVGNAFFQLVPIAIGGLAMAVLEDRERYQMFKYVVLAPAGIVPWLLGHAVCRAALSATGVAALLALGALAFGIRPPAFHPVLFFSSLLLGLITLAGIGLALAGAALHVARHGNFMWDAIGGAFFMLSGVVFPLDVLPVWLRWVSCASPVTWWLEGLRRSLGLRFGETLSVVSDLQLLLILALAAALSAAFGLGFWKAAVTKARRKGLLDTTTAM